ncbi:MAG: UDP-N-acetylglucosamine 1-carboxyvinyltransferase [Candidatus Bipolaricaulota bacterium]|nr:UDP-N-acetylglucosamine 1-carboxyvinyltransferase [Candidatus Bipolaricaulota bacterium]
MDALIIEGGQRLSGRIAIEGAKNAALPACVAALLTDEPIILRRVPQLRDVSTILYTLGALGKRVVRNEGSVVISGDGPLSGEANPYSVRKMRASFLVLGPLLARLGRARVPLPGGCAIGARPVDLHLRGLETLGARIDEHDGVVDVSADRLRGARIELAFPSVGATEQLVMTATLAEGVTEIANAAVEPEVLDLVKLLRAMGAEIAVEGRTIRVATSRLHAAEHTLIPDRMEAGTMLLAAAIARGEATADDVDPDDLGPLSDALRRVGVDVQEDGRSVTVSASGPLRGTTIETAPHPGFPTDLHPPFAALLTVASGTSRVAETVFESRFTYVDPLRAMGAQIAVDGRTATINGVDRLRARTIEAPDIRAGAALVLAALAADGTTTLGGLEHIDRGYERLTEKLQLLGAKIERQST